ncbi:MAG: geranylgeranylglycerol-phosphate geranylgeranyltransferase [Bacteroidota bacterium]|nr:geranylgeranylglycerol-phosphate geranylgeranyltransferase [Bacteroidota bacterium]
MIAFLKLIRVQNLLIIAFTQYMIRWCLILPIFRIRGFELQLSSLHFFLIVLSTVMIAAAGYIINDYFDVRIDKVNKPERMVIDKGVKRRVAMGAHTVINILAIGISLFVAWRIGSWKLSIIHFICASGLWFYSTTFKRQFLIGNIIIAVFTALVPLVTGLYELLPCYKFYAGASFKDVWVYIFAVSFFAFITTLLREIIKDIEDHEGDKAFGCKTMPIVIGIRSAKNVAILISVATMICLAYMQMIFWKGDNQPAFWYFVIALQLPFVFLIWKTHTALSKKDLRIAGNTAKMIMFFGVCYLFLFAHFILTSIHVN